METNNTMAVIRDESAAIVAGITESNDVMYSSFTQDDIETKRLMYQATNGGTPIADVKNKTLEMRDVVVMAIEVKNDDGTTSIVPRSSIITKDGKAYSATSWGVYNCLKRLNAIFGTLHFEDGLKIVAKDVKTKAGSTISLDLV